LRTTEFPQAIKNSRSLSARQESSASSAVLGNPFPFEQINNSQEINAGKAKFVAIAGKIAWLRLAGQAAIVEGMFSLCLDYSLHDNDAARR
jgi:hypothetical protein